MNRFQHKVVIVTGGGSGIGRATAIQFAKEGAIVIVADINADGAKETIAQIYPYSRESKHTLTDVSSSESVADMVAFVLKEFRRIDLLINNAGIEISGEVVSFSELDFDTLSAVNFKSVFLCSKAVLPTMILQKSGVIINTASVASVLAWPNDVVYSATKAGVLLLTKGMAVEYAKYNIRVNAVAPSIINTAMTTTAFAKYPNTDTIMQEKMQLQPLGRLGEAEEVAEAILFLSSNGASFITGVILPVDGGYLAG